MTARRGSLPTLTEVIDIEADALAPAPGHAVLPPESLPMEAQPLVLPDPAMALTTQVLDTLRPRIDALLASRLQAAIAPHLERLSDELVQTLRAELSAVMQKLVSQAVNDVLARRHKT